MAIIRLYTPSASCIDYSRRGELDNSTRQTQTDNIVVMVAPKSAV